MKDDVETVEIEVMMHHETDDAVLVSDDGERKNAKWLPKAAIKIRKAKNAASYFITISEKLAIAKGFC